MLSILETIRNLALLALGFGFVVFWHELGHFIAAKWAGVKVDQFAVGFGQALCSWRKGIGFRVGNTQADYQKRIGDHIAAADARKPKEEVQLKEKVDGPTDRQMADAAAELGLGETEYRLNWLPLGGYVKMLGQDDLKANSEADDPRAFNRQSIGKRMVIVSAGVVMNVILAAIGFMVLFLMGFNVAPATVGAVYPGSPAQAAKLLPGDVIISIDGKDERSQWTKIQLDAALCASDEKTDVVVERTVDGKPTRVHLQIEPKRGGLSKEFLGFGILPAQMLKAPTVTELKEAGEATENEQTQRQMYSADALALKPGDVITQVDGKPVDGKKDVFAFLVLDRALQSSNGKPVHVVVTSDEGAGAARPVDVQPHFMEPFGEDPLLNFAGMVPRVLVGGVPKNSPCFGKLLPGDVITQVSTNTGSTSPVLHDPSIKAFHQRMNEAGKSDAEISVTVLRGSELKQIDHLHTKKIDPDNSGLKIQAGYDEDHPVVADVQSDSAAQKAQIPARATLVSVGGMPVASWFDVQTAMKKWIDAHPDAPLPPLPVTYKTVGGEPRESKLDMSPPEVAAINNNRYQQDLLLVPERFKLATRNPLKAAWWGVTETRDFILQFYLTLRRMATGGVSPNNMMGPIGILQVGTGFASKGNDWLIWFLAMISANLAVVNFLPIPIVDGGLFTFLILEKLKGKPLSPKTQAVAQYVGLALLLGIFLFVTWHDLINFPFRMH